MLDGLSLHFKYFSLTCIMSTMLMLCFVVINRDSDQTVNVQGSVDFHKDHHENMPI